MTLEHYGLKNQELAGSLYTRIYTRLLRNLPEDHPLRAGLDELDRQVADAGESVDFGAILTRFARLTDPHNGCASVAAA